MSNQPNEPQDECRPYHNDNWSPDWCAVHGQSVWQCKASLESQLAAADELAKSLSLEVSDSERKLATALAANHELGESLFAMSEKYQAMAGERDGLVIELRSIADMLSACGYEADTLPKAVEALIDDDRNTIQRHNATWNLLQRNLVHPDTGQPHVSLSIMELAQMMIDERDLLRQQRNAAGEAVKQAAINEILKRETEDLRPPAGINTKAGETMKG